MNQLFDSLIRLPYRNILLLSFIWMIRSSSSFSHPTHPQYRTRYGCYRTIRTNERPSLDRRMISDGSPSNVVSHHPTELTFLLHVRGGQEDENSSTHQVQTQPYHDKNEHYRLFDSSMMMSISSLGTWYSLAIQRAPIITKSMTAGMIFLLSDWFAQYLERKQQYENDDNDSSSRRRKQQLQWNRMIASGIVGLCYFGPAAHYWYEWIFRILPGVTLYDTIRKACLGQLLFGPTFTCIFFASSLFQLQQFTFSNWYQKIKHDLPSAMLAGIGFWPFVDLISYSYIPPTYIPLFVNICSFIWTTYLALKSYAT
jgi:protein Mpv17